MKILGYSERGVINALFYDILNNSNQLIAGLLTNVNNSNQLISGLLNKTIFIHKKEIFDISCCQVLIEQSFSDFGDSDVLILVKNNGKKQAVFLEAKVKTYSRKKWRLDEEFNKFLNPKGEAPSTDNAIPTSNLFTQLYFKNRLWCELKNNNGKNLDEGIKFKNTTKSPRKIGTNKIVTKAKKLLSKHLNKSFYFGIVPDSRKDIENFIKNHFKDKTKIKHNLTNWKDANWGFLAWEDIHKFCVDNGLNDTCNVFDFNFYEDKKNQDKSKGQIYNKKLITS